MIKRWPLRARGYENSKAENTMQQEFRNPLSETRVSLDSNNHYIEGQQVSRKIIELLRHSLPLMEKQTSRPIKYSDIIILARNRTNLAQSELRTWKPEQKGLFRFQNTFPRNGNY